MPEFSFNSRRSPVYSARGIVAASQPLAVAAGLEILRQGGNAVDAAIAVAAALNVTEPGSTGLGGDCFALVYDHATGQVSALNGSGRAPAALTLERLQRDGFSQELPQYHPYTVTVPGACAGWCDLLEHSGSLPLAQVLAPAIRLAEEGFPVAPVTAFFWQRSAERQLATAWNGGELTLAGRGPRPGERFHNPGLARTLRQIAEGGKTAFYQGPVAEAIVQAVQSAGGCLELADLAEHVSAWEEPLSVEYRGVRIWECPPNGQGLVALLALNLLEGFELAEMPPLSAERLHLVIEALRLAFADARWFVADPAFAPAPLAELLSKDYADQRRKLIDPRRANLNQARGHPLSGSDTVYFCVVDEAGNACSFINSNYMGFGTGIVPKGWGFSLQNRGHGFSLDPQHPNCLAPRKRPYHTIIPALATAPGPDGRQALLAAFGVMGGFMQPQGHVQVVLGMVDDGLDPQEALDRPRVCLSHGEAADQVALEEGIPGASLEALAEMGHPVVPTRGEGRAVFGRGQIIQRLPDGILCGGSDPRADGCAMTVG